MVYFITDGSYIKIGYTKNNSKKRLKQLQTSNASELFLLGYIDGDKTVEKELHNQFSSSIVRQNGEWFFPTEDLMDYINKNNLNENIYVDIIDGTIEIAFYEGLIDYVWKELLNVYKFEGITDEVLESIKEELYIVNMNELKNKVNELTNKCNELLNKPRTEENIELCREYLKEIDNLLANIEVYNGEVEEVEG